MTSFLDVFQAIPHRAKPYPFSFVFDGKPSGEFLDAWPCYVQEERLDADRTRLIARWTDPRTGLRVLCEAIRFSDFPAVEWLLHFENTGAADTPIIEKVSSLDLAMEDPLTDNPNAPYWFHKTQ